MTNCTARWRTATTHFRHSRRRWIRLGECCLAILGWGRFYYENGIRKNRFLHLLSDYSPFATQFTPFLHLVSLGIISVVYYYSCFIHGLLRKKQFVPFFQIKFTRKLSFFYHIVIFVLYLRWIQIWCAWNASPVSGRNDTRMRIIHWSLRQPPLLRWSRTTIY